MITVYGADQCEDTQRSLRHLRRLGVEYRYENVDRDPEALSRAKALNNGERRTPTIDLEGETLVEPANRELTERLEERGVLSRERVDACLARTNIGDLERALRIGVGALAAGFALRMKSGWKWPLVAWGAFEIVTGAVGYCPAYAASGMTSLAGPGDRPRESERSDWLAPVRAISGGEARQDATPLTP